MLILFLNRNKNQPDIKNGCVAVDKGVAENSGDAASDDGTGYWGIVSCPWIRFFTCILRRSRIFSLKLADKSGGCNFLVLIGEEDVGDGPDAVKNIWGIDI